MAFDINKWLTEDMGFSAEEAAELAPKFNGERVTKLEGGFLRQSDYSRQMNDLKKAQTDLEAANARLNEEMADWAQVQARGGEMTAKMQKDLEAAQARVATLTARVTNIATQAGIDPTKALEGLETTVPPQNTNQPPANSIDTSKFASVEDVNTRMGQLANMALTLPAELYALATEHQSLFGKPLDTREIVKELQTRASTRNNAKSLDPRTVWEELHKVPEAREAKSKAEHDAEIKAAEQRGREAALSEMTVPGGSTHVPGRTSSPLFGGERKSVLQRPQPGTTTQAAASAFRSGKYRQGAAGAAKTA